jgi:hypothetical protein
MCQTDEGEACEMAVWGYLERKTITSRVLNPSLQGPAFVCFSGTFGGRAAWDQEAVGQA